MIPAGMESAPRPRRSEASAGAALGHGQMACGLSSPEALPSKLSVRYGIVV
jgi:hypothetical protein